MRTPAIDAALERALSRSRLGRYLAASSDITDAALSLYERNQRISEAFHRPLMALEVCVRNRMSAALSARYGPNWYRITAPPFEQGAHDKLDKAMDDLARDRVPLTEGAVVAELTFGFWVTILAPKYEPSLWTPMFSGLFLEGGRRIARQKVHNRLNALRKFRNRVAHYEPIYHLNPTQVHAEIIQTIAWLCPDTAVWAFEHSRVPYVLANPWPP